MDFDTQWLKTRVREVDTQVTCFKLRCTYIAPHLRITLSAALSSQRGSPFSLCDSRPSPHTRTLTYSAMLSCRLNGLYLRNQYKYMCYTHLPTHGKYNWPVWLIHSGQFSQFRHQMNVNAGMLCHQNGLGLELRGHMTLLFFKKTLLAFPILVCHLCTCELRFS